ncbi:hypothetical protein [Natrinema caseinilyticum]|nr:hypothetical protein [Natrinema caseinilyticum]
MAAREFDDSADQFDSPIDQPDLRLYLPGTPSVTFLEYVEVAMKMLFGR